MKKALALFSLIARHSVGKVLAVLVLLTAGNAAAFFPELGNRARSLSSMLDSFILMAVFLGSFLALSSILCRQLADRGGHQNYFLNRLRLRGATVYWTHVLYNSLCYFLLFAVEALSLLVLCMITVSRFPESYNHQSIVMACWQSDLLHTFFPLSDWLGWLTNGVILAGLGIFTAAAPTKNRNGKSSFSAALMILIVVVCFLWQWLEYGAIYPESKNAALIATTILAVGSFLHWYASQRGEDK